MGSLKEIKSRIQSVRSTQKITSAMKMVSSAKLRKAEKSIESLYPYSQSMNGLLANFLSADNTIVSPFTIVRDAKKVAIVAISSNSSLCGSFNANVAKTLQQVVTQSLNEGAKSVKVIPIGKKITQACAKMGLDTKLHFDEKPDELTYSDISTLADELMLQFEKKEIDCIKLVYFHFKNKSAQQLTTEVYLPFQLPELQKHSFNADYIIEPDKQSIIDELVPKVLRLKLYTVLLDSYASEHAARTMAMQIATDNANDLLQELSLQYNKSRQQAITSELLDIIGGTFK